MTKTLANGDIVTIYKALNDASSFMKNSAIKLPSGMMWSLRKNMKALSPIFELISETEKELFQECMKPEFLQEVTDDQGSKQQQIKQEFMQEFVAAVNVKISELSLQKNEVVLDAIQESDIEKFVTDYDGKISMPELDALEFFIAPNEKEEK